MDRASVTPGPPEGVDRPIRPAVAPNYHVGTMTETTETPAPVQDAPSKPSRPVRSSLKTFFKPQSVALIGATEKAGSVGRTILSNLIASPFGGTVYPVNPKRPSVLGIQSHPNVASIPEQVDLAIIVTPPASIPGIIEECGEAGVPTAVVISAGFKEVGEAGAKLERDLVAKAEGYGMRVIGPNCLGVMSPISGLNATFAAGMANKGRVSFIGQSGALITAILDWSLREGVGFSSIVSLGSMADVGWGDLIDYLGDDPDTDAIVLYMETVGDARAFLSAVREVALHKPIIVMKPGRSEEASRAAASHTGSLTGSDEVLDAAFRRTGVLRADRISDLFYFAEILGKQPLPKGPRLTVLTNAGGPGVLATDALIRSGGKLAILAEETVEQARRGPAAHVEQGQPHRHHRRRAARPLRGCSRDHGQGPRLGRPTGHPHAPGDDRSEQDSTRTHPVHRRRGQAHPGQLDGWQRRRERRAHPQRGRHRHLPVPRQRGAHVHRAGRLQREPQVAL